MQRSRLNIALAVVLVGLAAGIFFSQKKEEKKPPLTTLTPETINTVLIEHPDAPAIKLEKRADGGWKLTQPVQAVADKFEINGILNLATLEQKKTIAPATVKLADLGLAPPEYTVTLNNLKLAIGGMEPIQFQRYIENGDVIALTDDPPSAALDKDYADLVSKSLLPENADIQKIEVPGLTVEKSADGKWSVTPLDEKVSADQIQKFVDGWKSARSLWNELDTKEGKDAKGELVTITLKDGVMKLLVVAREPQLQIDRPDIGVKFNLSKALSDEILKLPSPPPTAPAPTTPALPAPEKP